MQMKIQFPFNELSLTQSHQSNPNSRGFFMRVGSASRSTVHRRTAQAAGVPQLVGVPPRRSVLERVCTQCLLDSGYESGPVNQKESSAGILFLRLSVKGK